MTKQRETHSEAIYTFPVKLAKPLLHRLVFPWTEQPFLPLSEKSFEYYLKPGICH